jgi:hypothetical protein
MKTCHLQANDGTEDHDVKRNKPDWERQILLVLSHIWNLYLIKNQKKDMSIKWGLNGEQRGMGSRKGEGEMRVNAITSHYMHVWNRIMKLVKIVF